MAEMVNAINTASERAGRRNRVAVVDKSAFRGPIDSALSAGIPVVSYNADGARDDVGSNRLAYIGQGLYDSGYALGQRALAKLDSGDVVGVHRDARPAQHSATHRRRTAGIQGLRQAGELHGGGHQRRRDQGTVHHRRVRPGPPEPRRHARGGRGFHPGGGADGGQVPDAQQGSEGGRRLRPGARDARPRSRAATSTTPSTSSRTYRASSRSSRSTSTSCPAA